MLFPVIKIKEKRGDKEITHIVGTNSHDSLFIEGNAIHYSNLQGMVGTRYPDESGMYFSGREPDEYSFSPYAEVEMVTMEELIEIAEQNMVKQTDASIRMHNALKQYYATKSDCDDKRSKDDISDTSGMLF